MLIDYKARWLDFNLPLVNKFVNKVVNEVVNKQQVLAILMISEYLFGTKCMYYTELR